MVGRSLNFFDALSVLNRKLGEHLIHEIFLGDDLLDGGLVLCNYPLIEKRLEPAELDINAEPHKSILGEVGSKRVAALGVSAIDWANRRQWTN